MNRTQLRQILWMVIAINLLVFLAGCSTAWITSAIDILKVLTPAIASLLGLLGTVGVPAPVIAAFQGFATLAGNGLTEVQTLVTQYQAAAATDQPGILAKIDTAINVILSNLETILPTVRITDPASQTKWTGMITDWAEELEALLNLIPVIQGTVADHDEVMKRVVALKSAKLYKSKFNADLKAFGPKAQALKL